MCTTCGCSDGARATITDAATGRTHAVDELRHEHHHHDHAACIDYARRVHPDIEVLQVSTTKGEDLDDWLRARVDVSEVEAAS